MRKLEIDKNITHQCHILKIHYPEKFNKIMLPLLVMPYTDSATKEMHCRVAFTGWCTEFKFPAKYYSCLSIHDSLIHVSAASDPLAL